MKQQIKYFSDLDDTITANSCLFYSKIIFLKKKKDFKEKKEKYFFIVFQDFKINKNFLEIIKSKKIREVFILSRNDNDFIKYFISNFNKKYSKKYGFVITGGIGEIKTKDKIKYINGKGILISDIFECKRLKKYDNFLCIENYDLTKKYYIYFVKTILLGIFLIKNYIK